MVERLSILFSHPNTDQYKQDVYSKLRASAIGKRHHLVLPHETSDQPMDSLQFLRDHQSNVILIADITGKRFGVGTEVGMAKALDVPIHALIQDGSALSRSGQYLADQVYWYSDTAGLVAVVEQIITAYETQKTLH